jgi:hypothetical protein
MIPIKELLRRITGFSIPVFGISWEAPPSERRVVEKVIVEISGRRALFYPLETLHAHNPFFICDSVLEFRKELTQLLKEVPIHSTAAQHIRAMRAACMKFLDGTEQVYPELMMYRKYDPKER